MEQITDKLKSWATILDWGTRQQAITTASMPFVWPYLALMPDAHLGKGATVGSVIPTRGAIMPAAVGVDIGCGMAAWRLNLTTNDLAGMELRELRERIEQEIPLSPGNYNTRTWNAGTEDRIKDLESTPGAESASAITGGSKDWRMQLGSLGGGNHFIEVTADEEGFVWLFLHSGSRGVGNRLATAHIKVARELRKNDKLPDKDLAWLEDGTAEFELYIRDLEWAQHFAALNRDEMMERVYRTFNKWYGGIARPLEKVNCHHNYTEVITYDEHMVWLSRKGAINAHEGRRGLIPGSMATASYVVTGKGNREALWSSPHGAGRMFSRRKAKETFTEEQLQESMKGIEWRSDSGRTFLDEIAGAYKDIDQVMLDSKDLVRVDHELHQLVNVKGE
jgi:tRNA-splicing ligase RtcB (3'-phosphate/5'-hydroxy nucleic acid ligase)